MAKRKSKTNRSWLLGKCRARGITVAGLARKARGSRPFVDFATERPSRHPLTFALMNKGHGLWSNADRLKRLVIAPQPDSIFRRKERLLGTVSQQPLGGA